MDMIIFSGQSNMQGESERISECDTVLGAFEYKWLCDELVPLKNPVGENITYSSKKGFDVTHENADLWRSTHALGASCYGNTNLVPSFCKTYTMLTKRQVIAVHAAKGSTVISDWLQGSPIYKVMKQKICGAVKKFHPERIFFVWLQGESDAISGTNCGDYFKSISAFQKSLKSDFGIHAFGLIRVGRFTGDARDDEIIRAQDEICRKSKDFVMLTDIATELNKRPEYMNPNVKGHFSASGLEVLGNAAAIGLAHYVFEKHKDE